MNTPRVELHVASDRQVGSDSPQSAGGQDLDLARDSDPLRRLEVELQRAGAEQSDGERLHEQAWTLLEEAWGLLTECLVLRDGLLDACHEIEQTMGGIQQRLGSLPAALHPGAEDRTSISEHGMSSAVKGGGAGQDIAGHGESVAGHVESTERSAGNGSVWATLPR